MEYVQLVFLGWIALMLTMVAGSLGHMAENHDPAKDDDHREGN